MVKNDIFEYKNLLGLSCVENQVMAILQQNGINIVPLYADCAVPLPCLIREIAVNGINAEQYRGIPRIQDTAKEMSVIELKRYKAGFEQMTDTVRKKTADYVLIRITQDATKSIFFARGFRKDHFALVRFKSGKWTVINDIPAVTHVFSHRELSGIYDGELFVCSVKHPITKETANRLFLNRIFKPEDGFSAYAGYGEFDLSKYADRLGQLLRVYKILRSRMKQYYGSFISTDFISIDEINRLQTRYEYDILKKGSQSDSLLKYFNQLAELDTYIMKICCEKMKGCLR